MKNFLFVVLMLLVGLIARATSGYGNEGKHKWPVIQPVKKSIHFVDHQNMGAKLKIVGKDETPLYLLECYLNAYEYYENENNNFAYSGDFECRLTSLYSPETYSTLLTEEKHPTRDWQSRGRFFAEELTGKCAEYSEYGRIRHFRLRGMNLTLNIQNFKMATGSGAENAPWNTVRIDELDLDVTITPDPNALSEIAEPTKYLEPPVAHPRDPHDRSLKCDKVLEKTGGKK